MARGPSLANSMLRRLATSGSHGSRSSLTTNNVNDSGSIGVVGGVCYLGQYNSLVLLEATLVVGQES